MKFLGQKLRPIFLRQYGGKLEIQRQGQKQPFQGLYWTVYLSISRMATGTDSMEPGKRLASSLSPLQEEQERAKKPHTTLQLPEGAPDWAQFLCDKLSSDMQCLKNSFDSMKVDNDLFRESTQTSVDMAIASAKSAVDRVDGLEKRLAELEKENSALRKELQQQDKKISTVQNRQIKLETYSRSENLEIHGIPEVRGENCEKKARTVMRDIGMQRVHEVELSRCHRIGPRPQAQLHGNALPRPIICSFQYQPDRDDMWSKRKNLKGTDIFLKENFPPEIDERRRILLPCYQKAMSLDKYKNKVFLNKDKLILENITYTVENIDKLPPELNPEVLATPSSNGVTLFYTSMSPFSNMYRVNFNLDDADWICTEQYYSYKMAQHAGDPIAMRDIRNAQSGRECKAITKRLTELDRQRWNECAPEVLSNAVRAKFTQNQRLRDLLIDTGENILGEANPHCSYWGIGKSMKKREAFDHKSWPEGSNVMGQILMDLREQLKND